MDSGLKAPLYAIPPLNLSMQHLYKWVKWEALESCEGLNTEGALVSQWI